MKQAILNIICFLLGIFFFAIIGLIAKGQLDYTINIIDALMLIVTISLSALLLLLTKKLEKNDLVRDMIVNDLKELCKMYGQNTLFLQQFSNGRFSKKELVESVRMVFHKTDMLIDSINKQLNESFPKFFKMFPGSDLTNITSKYYKWLTGGTAMTDTFVCNSEFMIAHETQLFNTISEIKVVIHKFLKNS